MKQEDTRHPFKLSLAAMSLAPPTFKEVLQRRFTDRSERRKQLTNNSLARITGVLIQHGTGWRILITDLKDKYPDAGPEFDRVCETMRQKEIGAVRSLLCLAKSFADDQVGLTKESVVRRLFDE